MLKEYFESHNILNQLLLDPVQKGRINASALFTITGLIIILVALLLPWAFNSAGDKWNWKWRIPKIKSLHRFVWDLFTSPIQWSVSVAASLLQDAIADHYRTQKSRTWLRRYILNVIGAVVIAFIGYVIAWSILILSSGLPLDPLDKLIFGDMNARWDISKHIYGDYFWLFTPVFVLFSLAVIGKAKVQYLEKKYWDLRRVGLRVAFDLATWDEFPKLSVPKADLVKEANQTIQDLLSAREIDHIRLKAASGYNMFGADGFLKEVLKRPNNTWKILLLNPESAGAKRRAQHYLSERASDPPSFKQEKDYLDGITTTLNTIKEIKEKHNPNIEVHLYDHTPQWRLIIFSGFCVVSGFGPGQRSDRAPLSIFENSSTSLFHGYQEMFEDIWHNDSTKFL